MKKTRRKQRTSRRKTGRKTKSERKRLTRRHKHRKQKLQKTRRRRGGGVVDSIMAYLNPNRAPPPDDPRSGLSHQQAHRLYNVRAGLMEHDRLSRAEAPRVVPEHLAEANAAAARDAAEARYAKARGMQPPKLDKNAEITQGLEKMKQQAVKMPWQFPAPVTGAQRRRPGDIRRGRSALDVPFTAQTDKDLREERKAAAKGLDPTLETRPLGSSATQRMKGR